VIALARAGAVLCSAVAMLALLLGLAAVALGRPDRAAVYLAVAILDPDHQVHVRALQHPASGYGKSSGAGRLLAVAIQPRSGSNAIGIPLNGTIPCH